MVMMGEWGGVAFTELFSELCEREASRTERHPD